MSADNQPIQLAKDTITKDNINLLVQWLSQETTPQLTKGPKTEEFEKLWAKEVGTQYAVFVNSGSSANLISLYVLKVCNRLRNNNIVVPALSWITDISPVIQLGMNPILCDCNMKDLSVDLKHLEEIFEKDKPSVLLLVSILGLVPEMEAIEKLCYKHGVILMLDNCEGLGSTYGQVKIENFALLSTTSLYFGHHISTIEGGMVTTSDFQLYQWLKILRSHGWDRDVDTALQKELRHKWNINEFNARYTFYKPAFNVRSTDLQAFIGIQQLLEIENICYQRAKNYGLYNKHLQNNYWKPEIKPEKFVSNLGYPIIHPNRDQIVKALEENGVEVRPLVSGSMGSQPFFIELFGEQKLPNASIIDSHGLYVPNHASITETEVKFICDIVNKITGAQPEVHPLLEQQMQGRLNRDSQAPVITNIIHQMVTDKEDLPAGTGIRRSPINDFFDAVFCINLKRRPDRLESVKRQFHIHNINVEYIEAVDGNDLEITEFIGSDNEKGTKGDIGCVLSHLKVAQIAKDRGLKNYFVFEDDAEIADNFNEQFAAFTKELPDDWQMYYLGGNHDKPFTRLSTHMAQMWHTFTTHAIGINASIYDTLIETLAKQADKVDLYFSSLHATHKCYVCQPHLVFQAESFSDITMKHADYKHLRNHVFVPFGLRCSAATIIESYFDRQVSLPLDWVDLPITAMITLFTGMPEKKDVAPFITEYLRVLHYQRTDRHPTDRTWFPHDFTDPNYPISQLERLTSQYIRRFERLYNLFASGNNLVFLTVIPEINENVNVQPYEQLKALIIPRVKGECIFVSVNMRTYEYAEDKAGWKERNVNVQVHNDNWGGWEEEIHNRLKGFEHTKKYFL